ncbi:MAG: hypothetical protein U5L96_09930 [Owenweeksia sp.]|nr:hypothetical protein [Owenweeksia sp.]
MAKLHTLMAVSALLGNHLLMGQVNLVIEDETEQGFFLGINGYLQNIEKSQQTRTTSLDTVPYVVLIDTDTTQIAKRIHLREPGTHRYVLTRNFYNELKLRYREK